MFSIFLDAAASSLDIHGHLMNSYADSSTFPHRLLSHQMMPFTQQTWPRYRPVPPRHLTSSIHPEILVTVHLPAVARSTSTIAAILQQRLCAIALLDEDGVSCELGEGE